MTDICKTFPLLDGLNTLINNSEYFAHIAPQRFPKTYCHNILGFEQLKNKQTKLYSFCPICSLIEVILVEVPPRSLRTQP